MTVLSGEVKTTISMRGAGDAAVRVEQTNRALKGTETASKGVSASLLSMRGNITNIVGAMSQAGGRMASELGAIGGVVEEVSSSFGVWGTVIGTVAVGVGALVAVFAGMPDKLTAYGEAMAKSLKPTQDMSGAITQLATEAASAKTQLAELGKTAMNALAALAELRGDKEGADLIRKRQGAVESAADASKAASAYTEASARLGTAKAIEKQSRDDITEAERALDEAMLQHDKSAKALAAARLFTARYNLSQAQQAIADTQAVLGRLATVAATTGAVARETQMQAGLTPGVGFFTPSDPTNLGPGKAGAPRAANDNADALIGALSKRADSQDQRAIDEAARSEEAAWKKRMEGYDAAANALITVQDSGARAAMAIRDFSGALAEAMPRSEAFAGALQETNRLFGDYAVAAQAAAEAKRTAEQEEDPVKKQGLVTELLNKEAAARKAGAQAAIGSIGAIAKAGAQQIKDERARAGVLSIIYLGLGTAHILTPGFEAQGAGELAAAGILGAVAIFSSGKSGSKAAGPNPSAIRPVSDNSGGAPIVLNINAPWFGPSPQEAAAGLAAFLGRADGTGFGAAA